MTCCSVLFLHFHLNLVYTINFAIASVGSLHQDLFLTVVLQVNPNFNSVYVTKFAKILHVFTYVGTHCCANFKGMAVFNLKLLIAKVSKLDVCGRPLFANPVTYIARIQYTVSDDKLTK